MRTRPSSGLFGLVRSLARTPESEKPHPSGVGSFRRFASKRSDTTTLILKSTQALLLALAVCFSVGATDAGSRYNNLNHRLMCTCGCAQLLGECNHVGCPESGRERNELSAAISSGLSDQQILDS